MWTGGGSLPSRVYVDLAGSLGVGGVVSLGLSHIECACGFLGGCGVTSSDLHPGE